MWRPRISGLNQYTQAGGAAHSWNANGNLTSDGLTTFGYDTENRLVSASGAKNATLAYDPLGRLYQVTSGANTTRFVYDGDRLIAEYDGSGTLRHRYVHGAGIDEPLVWYEGAPVSSATRRYLHANHQGSIVAMSASSGAMQQVRSYDAYGVTAADNTLRFQYTGQAAILELGLLYYKARFYNPALGRFMQTDPIGYEDDYNLYAYVGNDPLNRTDPTGQCGAMHPTDPGLCKINPDPDGDGRTNITFVNEDPNGPSPDQFVRAELAAVVEGAVVDTGSDININSAGRDASLGTPSNHNPGKNNAVDINKVNGGAVDQSQANAAPLADVRAFQDSVAEQLGVRENYGPTRNEKTELSGRVTDKTNAVGAQHRNHVHIASQACVRAGNTCVHY